MSEFPRGTMPYKNKEDQLAAQRRHYSRNKQQYLDKNKRQRSKLKDEVSSFKESNPCTDCGNFFPACVMDFDHLNSEDKVGNVSKLIAMGIAATREEMLKCELVCANCHRIRTSKRRSGMV